MLNDKASAVFNSGYALGCVSGPLIGGILNDVVGFRYTCDIMAFCSCIAAVLYFLINIMPFWYKKELPEGLNESMCIMKSNMSHERLETELLEEDLDKMNSKNDLIIPILDSLTDDHSSKMRATLAATNFFDESKKIPT